MDLCVIELCVCESQRELEGGGREGERGRERESIILGVYVCGETPVTNYM